MATMKSYTDLAQSKLLAKILPLESADMYYSAVPVREWKDKEDTSKGTQVVFKEQVFVIENLPNHKIGEGDIYAWSLAALLNVLPFPQLSKDKLGSGKVGWMVSAYPYDCRYDSCWHDNQIDACYEMILKLHERKML